MIDQQPVARAGLRQWIQELTQSVELYESGSADDAMVLLEREPIDAVILDLDLARHDGIELIKRFRRHDERLAILVFTSSPEHRFGVRALRAGAIGYVSKGSSKRIVGLAVQRTLEGKHFMSRELSEILAQQITGGEVLNGYDSLSDREHQIVSMIVRGLTASQIASELSLSVKTVHTHRARALKKLKLKNNAELTHYAFRSGLAD